MRTVITKNGKIIHDTAGFYPMNEGELIFVGEIWYKVKRKTLHLPNNRLIIEVE